MEGTVTIKLSDYERLNEQMLELQRQVATATDLNTELTHKIMVLEDQYCGTRHFLIKH